MSDAGLPEGSSSFGVTSGEGGSSIHPEPTPEETAAIVAAVQIGLAGPSAEPPAPEPPSRWRFSGRWWSKPVPARRARP